MTGRIEAYNAALKSVATRERARGVAVDQGDLTTEQRHLIYGGGRDGRFDAAAHAFRLRVFEKYWPDAAAALRAEYGRGDTLGLAQMRSFATALGFAALLLLLPWAIVALRRPEGALGALPTAGALSAGLPAELATVRLPRMRYSVGIESGTVLKVDTAFETNIDTEVRGGGVAHTGYGTVAITHPTVTVRSKSVQVDRIWVRTPEGRELKWVFRGGRLEAREGHQVSVVWQFLGGDKWRAILGFNHDTREFGRINEPAHGLSGWPLWLASALVATGLAVLTNPWLALFALAMSVLYVGLIKAIFRIRRDRRFSIVHQPAYRRFLAEANLAGYATRRGGLGAAGRLESLEGDVR
ncbi:MAG: hypothetical protein JSS35_12465 [Proteobacteria bacterium]|nr:hypothetical protein [Pseudomonadota bacterium]